MPIVLMAHPQTHDPLRPIGSTINQITSNGFICRRGLKGIRSEEICIAHYRRLCATQATPGADNTLIRLSAEDIRNPRDMEILEIGNALMAVFRAGCLNRTGQNTTSKAHVSNTYHIIS